MPVHKTGNETVNGIKTFTGTSTYNDACPYCRNTSISGKLTPEVTAPIQTVVVGNSNTWYGNQTYILDANGECYWRWNAGSFRASDQSQGIWGFDFGVKRDFSSVFLRPQFNNAYWLGESDHQWLAVYAKNYYYNGVAWGLDKENTWSVAQFCSQNTIHVRNVNPGVAPSSDISAGMRFENANASYVFTDIVGRVYPSGTTFVNLIASNKFTNGALDPNGTTVSKNLQIGVRSNGEGFIYTECGWRNNLQPNASESGVYSLGTSTNKWKSLNGINPGALSLPDYLRILNIDTTNWSKTDGQNNYTPAFDGWLQITIPNDTDGNGEKSNFITILDSGFDPFTGITASDSKDYRIQITFPVVANHEYYIYIKSYSQTIMAARLIKCLGNVV